MKAGASAKRVAPGSLRSFDRRQNPAHGSGRFVQVLTIYSEFIPGFSWLLMNSVNLNHPPTDVERDLSVLEDVRGVERT